MQQYDSEQKEGKKMKRIILVMIVSGFAAGCNYTGKPVEFANLCDKANNREYIEVTGFFRNTGSAMCSKSGNEPMRCPIGFADKPEAVPAMAYIDLGSGASSIENIEGKGLTIRDVNKQDISNNDKVKVTASLLVYDTPPQPDAKYVNCSITVKKIEKTQ
jgi:hypothetical protein